MGKIYDFFFKDLDEGMKLMRQEAASKVRIRENKQQIELEEKRLALEEKKIAATERIVNKILAQKNLSQEEKQNLIGNVKRQLANDTKVH